MKLGKLTTKTSRKTRRIIGVIVIVIGLIVGGTILAKQVYDTRLAPVSGSQKTQIFTIEKGSSVKKIGVDLEQAKLIRSAWAFQVYVNSKGLSSKMQAGTYALSPSESTPEIVNILTKGRVTTMLVTILPGRRIDQVRADLINSGFEPAAVDEALKPANYADLPIVAVKPADVNSLEGLLWPESFQKDANSLPGDIIRQSLVAMGEQLTPDIQAGFAAQSISTYQGLILASMVMQEVSRPADQGQAAQVFLKRLKSNIPLGADVTTKYGAVLAGLAPVLTHDSVYNTHNRTGLPPTPISTVNASSLAAAARPANTDWLYFVAGDDGTTYFSTNIKEHEALTKQHCRELCGN